MSRHVRRWVDKLSDQNNKSDLEKKKIKIVRELCEKQNKTKQNKHVLNNRVLFLGAYQINFFLPTDTVSCLFPSFPPQNILGFCKT